MAGNPDFKSNEVLLKDEAGETVRVSQVTWLSWLFFGNGGV